MKIGLSGKLLRVLFNWLNQEVEPPRSFFLSDFSRLCDEMRPCDVLLIEGRNRISQMIKLITRSSWSHAALYIGRLYDIKDTTIRNKITQFYSGDPSDPLLIESLLGQGTLVSSLNKYAKEHIRICRPRGIFPHAAQQVIHYATARLGIQYDFRQIFDLGRFLLPWPLLPRKWHSSLFRYKPGVSLKESCSSLLAEAFQSANFPILPGLKKDARGIIFLKRNPRLYTPRDFDHSPYFDIIKYPMDPPSTFINARYEPIKK